MNGAELAEDVVHFFRRDFVGQILYEQNAIYLKNANN